MRISDWSSTCALPIWAVVVGAVAGDNRKPVGMVPGAHEVVGGRLAGRVGRVRLVGRLLGEEAVGAERAVDLIGRDVVEAESAPSAAQIGRASCRERVCQYV